MRLSSTLSIYIGRQFLLWFAIVFAALVSIIFLFDMVELLRRAASRPEASFGIIVQMAVLKLPLMAQKLLPFAVLFGGMFAFWRLTKSQELIVARAAGISAWQFLFPALVAAGLIGAGAVTVFNPIGSAMASRFEQLEGRLLRGQSSLLAVSSGGVWLRQADSSGQAVIHADRVVPDSVELRDVIFFLYKARDNFDGRIDAMGATLQPGKWVLEDAWISRPGRRAEFQARFEVKTNLTADGIQDSFAPPETMSFWELPGFIQRLESAGFTGMRHRLHWHGLLSSPLLLAAMLLFAAAFSMRFTRRGGVLPMVMSGITVGFLLYFLSDLVFALGLAGNLPVILAAWTPAGVSTLMGVAVLFHLEDG